VGVYAAKAAGIPGGCCGFTAGVLLSLILIFVINRRVLAGYCRTILFPCAWITLVRLVLATIVASYRPAQQAAQGI
jgi:hypothetical protein